VPTGGDKWLKYDPRGGQIAPEMTGLKDIDYVLAKLAFRRAGRIWPNGLVLLVSLHKELKQQHFLDEAVWLESEVQRVLGRKRGIRIGEEPDRDGQYFHYLAMWLYALGVLGRYEPSYRDKGIALAREIHSSFVVPGRGVIWKMTEDLSEPYPGFGFSALDAFDGYVSYRLLDEQVLAGEIAEMRQIIDRTAGDLVITQDLGLGMMLWMTQFFPEEWWAKTQRQRSLVMLDRMWMEQSYSRASPICPRCASPPLITACQLACRRCVRCRIAYGGSMPISRPIDQATNMTARLSL
jgi:hypothetical protein